MLQERLKNDILVFDGAMGTQLQDAGLKAGDIPECLNITDPKLIQTIHLNYLNAGADFITTNTFGANPLKMAEAPYSYEEIINAAIDNATIARKTADRQNDSYIVLDIGPIGQLLEPMGTLTFDEAYEIIKKQVIIAKDKVDAVLLETMTDIYEVKAGILAVKENSDLPVFVTMTYESNLRTLSGCDPLTMVNVLEGLNVDVLGVNCSLGPIELTPIIDQILAAATIPVLLQPNAGLPCLVEGKTCYNMDKETFVQESLKHVKNGVAIIGGCCGTTPAYVAKLKKMVATVNASVVKKKPRQLAVCTPLKTVVVAQPRIVGERINPTGKKRFKQALRDNDMNYILSQAIEQIDAGADILDVNVGSPDIDEKEMMVKVIKALQAIVDVPLQIDSTKPEVLEAALRVYNGKPIVNSVNGEEEVLDTILPIVAKYGGAVIGLALDENGIPPTAEGRVEIAKRIRDKAMSYGIPKEDIIIDCLTLTVSAEQKAAAETLKAMNIVKNELGLRTVLGVSNISFGLPNREIINKTFLTIAMANGLDLPIINPNVPSMVWAVKAYKVLAAIDENSMDFIDYSSKVQPEVTTTKTEVVKSNDSTVSLGSELADKILKAMETGMKDDGRSYTSQLLKEKEAMEIINQILIPALDVVGDKFEKGTIFLPQLILAADVAKECFDEIKNYLADSGDSSESKGKIIVATVKGDIHDIGKNIVKVILENYGYNVIDLGRDVDCMEVVNAAIENDVHLVGLSALMTTTLGSMEETIKLLREHNVDCKIMVGGAVLTEDYAMKIGADYYAKDAKMSADIAKKVLG